MTRDKLRMLRVGWEVFRAMPVPLQVGYAFCYGGLLAVMIWGFTR